MDSRYLIEKEGFEGPFDFELNRDNEKYHSCRGIYAFVTKNGKLIHVCKDDPGSDIVKIGETAEGIRKRLNAYWNLNIEKKPQNRTTTAWKIRHFRYFHEELSVLFKCIIDGDLQKIEGDLNDQFKNEHQKKPLLETQDEKGISKYKIWSTEHGAPEDSFLEPIGVRNQEEFEKRYNLPNLPKKNEITPIKIYLSLTTKPLTNQHKSANDCALG